MTKKLINHFKFKNLFLSESVGLYQRAKVLESHILAINNQLYFLKSKSNCSIASIKNEYKNKIPVGFINYSNVNPNDFEKVFNFSGFKKYNILIDTAYFKNQKYSNCWNTYEDSKIFINENILEAIIFKLNVPNTNGNINIFLSKTNIDLSKIQTLKFHLNPNIISLS